MKKFLEYTAGFIVENYSEKIGDICVVLPNRRGGLFLKQYLSKLIDKPVFMPDIFSIEDLVYHLSDSVQIEPVFLLFDFYKVYLETEGEKAGSFRDFVSWGDVVLRDFNEIDQYNINPDKIFKYIDEIKAVQLWNLNEKPLTEFQLKYLHFFNNLAELYKNLLLQLEKSHKVYQGLAFRKTVDLLENGKIKSPWSNMIFAGFNALTTTEKRIIRLLENKAKIDLLWDADSYYMDNKIQEAGYFLRKIKKEFKLEKLELTGNYLQENPKSIEITGVPKNVGQAKVCGDILKQLSLKQDDLSNTCIVLNDESILAPLLNSLPEEIDAFNLTMGLPLKNTPLFGLLNAFFILNENALQFQTAVDEKSYYFKDLIKIFEHPYINRLFYHFQDNIGPIKIIGKIRNSNQIFYNYEEICLLFTDLNDTLKNGFREIFFPWKNSVSTAVQAMQKILLLLRDTFIIPSEDNDESPKKVLDLEYIFHFTKLFNRLAKMSSEYSFFNDFVSLRGIFNQMVRTVSMPFYGEPLKGVQIMGMLETRTLDFDNIIMLSVNEDFIPSGKSTNSFIPFELKHSFQLPTFIERNAVFAYHFYRLIQRAKNVYLLYNTEANDLGGGDISRFITQIQHELIKANPAIEIKNSIFSLPVNRSEVDDSIVIEKTPQVYMKLDSLISKGISPSTLNIFRKCGLQFYFKFILGIDEDKEVEETIEASTLGTVVHDVLNKIYEPFRNQLVSAKLLKSFKTKIPVEVVASFKKNYSKGDIRYGKNHLISKVAESFIKNFINSEIKFLMEKQKFNEDCLIIDLEEKFLGEINLGGKVNKKVVLKGMIDRIDKVERKVRIIDYKTGKVEARELVLKSWEDLFDPSLHEKTFQLLFYRFIYSLNNPNEQEEMVPGIISLKNLSSGFMPVKVPQSDNKDFMKEFGNVLEKYISDIYDPDSPFIQTEKEKNCEYCSFKAICNR